MIARSWDGVTEAARADEYLEYVRRTGVSDLVSTDGNRGVYVLRKLEGERAHFRLVSLWDSMDGIRRFAGEDPEQARYYPEDARYLSHLEPRVEHYQVLIAPDRDRGQREALDLGDELRRVCQGDAWHGPALGELLADVSPAGAVARPLATAHTIWELVLHVAAWSDVIRRRLEGEAVEEPERGDFPAVPEPTAHAWAAAKAELQAIHERLQERVAGLTAAELDAKVPGRHFSARFQVGSAVRHIVYHTGQIGMLKKAGA